MVVSIVLGVLAGLVVGQVIDLTPDFWANAALWMLIGAAVAFLVDLVFVSPIRLWRKTERQLAELRDKPPVGMHIEHVDTQYVLQISGAGSPPVSISSNTIILGQSQEGILVPRGSVFPRAGHAAGVGTAYDATIEVSEGTRNGDTSFVPPELIDRPSESTDV